MGVVDYLVVNGVLLSETRGGVESDYIADPLGSTAALMSTAGAITDTFTYWPYGQIRTHVGSSITPYQHCGTVGYYTDGITGRVYVDARVYIPSVARWMTVDPYWPEQRPYLYVDSNPVTEVDSTGLIPVSCLLHAMYCLEAANTVKNDKLKQCDNEYKDCLDSHLKRDLGQCLQNLVSCRKEADNLYNLVLKHCGQGKPVDSPKPVRTRPRPINL